MFPAQALAEAMLVKGWRVKLSTDARGARYTGGFPKAVEVSVVRSATFARGGILQKVTVPFRILSGSIGATLHAQRDTSRCCWLWWLSSYSSNGRCLGVEKTSNDPRTKRRFGSREPTVCESC